MVHKAITVVVDAVTDFLRRHLGLTGPKAIFYGAKTLSTTSAKAICDFARNFLPVFKAGTRARLGLTKPVAPNVLAEVAFWTAALFPGLARAGLAACSIIGIA